VIKLGIHHSRKKKEIFVGVLKSDAKKKKVQWTNSTLKTYFSSDIISTLKTQKRYAAQNNC